MKKYKAFKGVQILALTLFLSICLCIPCFCYENNPLGLNLYDKSLLSNDIAWMSLSEQDRFDYILRYVPAINTLMGLPADTFSVSNIHLMEYNDPSYNLACAYTNYNTGQIYINMNRVNLTSGGGWAAIFALAHEMRHLYQDKYNTLPYNPQATIGNNLIYTTDPREIDANAFASQVVDFVMNCVDAEIMRSMSFTKNTRLEKPTA